MQCLQHIYTENLQKNVRSNSKHLSCDKFILEEPFMTKIIAKYHAAMLGLYMHAMCTKSNQTLVQNVFHSFFFWLVQNKMSISLT